jgi:hypothetical protein
MQSFSDTNGRIKEPLGGSSLEDWPSFLENFRGETTPLLAHVSRLGLIALSLRILPGLAVISTLWVLFLIALVSAFILLTSWVTQAGGSSASSTAVSHSVKNSAISTGRKPCLCLSPQCDDLKNTFEEGRSSLKFEIHSEEVIHAT